MNPTPHLDCNVAYLFKDGGPDDAPSAQTTMPNLMDARSTSAARSLNALVDSRRNAPAALLVCLAPNVPKALGVVGWLNSKRPQVLVVGTAANFFRV